MNKRPEIRPINAILIANRGEIASRIMRTCRKMGIRTIAVFSDADERALYVQEADLAVHIGASPASESYLNQDRLIQTAKIHGAEAIHPGYGFLSENATFARKCQEAGLIFIGPHPEAIESMGSKSRAKNIMSKSNVPIIPGYQGKDQSEATLIDKAINIGFPLLLKAAAGGGGKGMRIVRREEQLAKAIQQAKQESQSSFGDDELIIEKYIESGRHIEFQIFGDQHDNVTHLFERECTIQRRYQKVIEESPSPIMDDKLREIMAHAAISAAKALKYDNAGTVEFIYDEISEEFYFLEINTRLQVEHPVTEEITGLDLVEMQIESAQGLPLSIDSSKIQTDGYALEVRLYAEDADRDFAPVTGKILLWDIPELEGLRVETAVKSGSDISVYYDPMIAKLIVKGRDRSSAIRKMRYVLKHLVCLGTKTNQNFLLKVLEEQNFHQGKYNTHFIDEYLASDQNINHIYDHVLIAATMYDWYCRESERRLLRSIPSGWRNSFYENQKVDYTIGGNRFTTEYRFSKDNFIFEIGESSYDCSLVTVENHMITISVEGVKYKFIIAKNGQDFYLQNESFGTSHLRSIARFPKKEKQKIVGGYVSAMPSQIVKVLVESGDIVSPGDPLVVLSSMKMENTIEASNTGTVEEVYVKEGESVEADYLLLKLKSTE